MAERVLFLPGWGRSPAAIDVLAGYRELIREMRGSFDVDIFPWPTTQPTPTAPPTWRGAAEAVRSALTPGCHVVVVSGNVAIALMALDGETAARTLVCDGLQASPTTLRSIGMGNLADAAEVAWLVDVRSFTQGSLAFSQGSTEDELEADRVAMGDTYNSIYVMDFVRSFMDLDLAKERPRVLIPTLYFEADADVPGYSGMQDYFLSLVPQAETDYVEGWPRRQGDGAVGAELGRRIVAFLKRAPRATTLATVLLTDIVGSTARAVELGDRRWSELLEEHRAAIREQLSRYSGREVDTVGDGFLAAFDSPARGVTCALAIIEAVKKLGLDLRAGLHTGECETSEGKLTGVAVHIAARVSQEAETGEVWVSETLRQLLAGSGITFEDRGARALKGVEGKWRLYRALQA